MRKVVAMVAGLFGLATGQTPAHAAELIFGDSAGYAWTLTVNGTAFTSVDTGWIKDNGKHHVENSNYLAAINYLNADYRNWGVFDLSTLSGPVSSATLTMFTSNVRSGPFLYTLFDTSATLAQLDTDRLTGDLGGQALYRDLGSGVSYGSRVYTSADHRNYASIELNGSALAAILRAAGGQFALGGTIVRTTILGPSAVPEPDSWALLIVGFGAIGAVMRRGAKVSARLSFS